MAAFYGSFVTPDMLAQPTDLAAYTGQDAPDNAPQLLRSATRLVLDATNQAYYSVDPDTGLATDAQISVALVAATVIQAAAWSAMGYDPLTGGVITAQVAVSTKIGSASETFADANLASQARAAAITGLVPEALNVLRYNNLLIPNPWVFG